MPETEHIAPTISPPSAPGRFLTDRTLFSLLYIYSCRKYLRWLPLCSLGQPDVRPYICAYLVSVPANLKREFRWPVSRHESGLERRICWLI